MSRLSERIQLLKNKKKSALVSFISSNDPSYILSNKILSILPNCGVDIVEVGLPFSDPMADGPVIQRSSIRGIKAGFTVKKTLEMIKNFRKNDNVTPVILMGYFNTIYQHGLKKFFIEAKKSGIDGLIIVDLPPEENGILIPFVKQFQIDLIRLVTPTTDSKRLKTILKDASGFLYYVSVLGITGTKKPSLDKVQQSVKKIKKHTKLPIFVGFGISKVAQVSKISSFADGTVVGSSLVKIIEDSIDEKLSQKKMFYKIESFLKKLEKGCYI